MEDIRELKRRTERMMVRDGVHASQVSSEDIRKELNRLLIELSKDGEPQLEVLKNTVLQLESAMHRLVGGVYSDTEIIGAIRRGQIICHPLVPANINGSSLDVTLGGAGFWVANANKSLWYNPRDEEQVKRFFRFELPTRHDEFSWQNGIAMMPSVPPHAMVIPFYPGQRILAHTHEFVGILPPGTTSMQSRSTWGRNGVAVCIDAGWGDPGYATRWTMEIHNFNQEPMLLVVGERIAQIVFFKTGPVTHPYGSANSKYHTTDDLREIIAAWHPDMMLPKAYLDEYRAPLELGPIPDYSTFIPDEED